MTPFPWRHIGYDIIARGSPCGSRWDFWGKLLWASGYIINAVILFAVLTATGIIVDPDTVDDESALMTGDVQKKTRWAFIWMAFGWAASMAAIFCAVIFCERSAYDAAGGGAAGSAAGRAIGVHHRCELLLAFGIALEDGKMGSSNRWSFAVVSLLPALLAFFVAGRFLADPYHLTCDAPANMCPTDGTGGTMIAHFLSEDRTRCCVAVALRNNVSALLGQAGGNFISGWTIVKFLSKFLLWCDDDADAEKEEGSEHTQAETAEVAAGTEQQQRQLERSSTLEPGGWDQAATGTQHQQLTPQSLITKLTSV